MKSLVFHHLHIAFRSNILLVMQDQEKNERGEEGEGEK